MKNNCTLPHIERHELLQEIGIEQEEFNEARARLIRMINSKAPSMSDLEKDMLKVQLEEVLSAYERLYSAQNVAFNAGLTARGNDG